MQGRGARRPPEKGAGRPTKAAGRSIGTSATTAPGSIVRRRRLRESETTGTVSSLESVRFHSRRLRSRRAGGKLHRQVVAGRGRESMARTLLTAPRHDGTNILESKGSRRLFGCGAAIGQYSVAPDGRIYPCHRFVGLDRYVLGDVWSGVDRDKRRRFAMDCFVPARPKCSLCWARYYCGGGCAYINQQATGSLAEAPEQNLSDLSLDLGSPPPRHRGAHDLSALGLRRCGRCSAWAKL
jgi:radical SAM protein with 4Fe4S-binding SPASM domain